MLTRSRLTGALLIAFTAATAASAAAGTPSSQSMASKGDVARRIATSRSTADRHDGKSASMFLDAPACAIPDHESAGHMAIVHGRTRANGLIGGSYGEIFFAMGASTRASANAARGGGNPSDNSSSVSTPSQPGQGSNAGASGGTTSASSSSGASDGANAAASANADDPPAVPLGANGIPLGLPGGGTGAPVQVSPTAVNPEPSTWLLFGTALCGLLFARARQARGQA